MSSIIKFENVTKTFNLQKQKTFKEFLPALFGGQETHQQFNALEDISFEVKKGETVGIIGPNGSGKSTILKLVAKVMSPTSGTITVNGRVSPLIELGAGFHPELTGKENIYLNGTILGLKRNEIDKNFKNIVDFSDLWEFIDQPIKHYSSGMYVRLAFAVAVHTNPEILIVDEILAVGDTSFQDKCFKKMEEFKKNGVTILYVSHSLESIKSFCTRAIYINNSKIIADGDTESVCKEYSDNKNKLFIIKKLPMDNWHEYKELRLQSLKNNSTAFEDSYEKEKSLPDIEWKKRLQETHNNKNWLIFAKINYKLVGIVGATQLEIDKQNNSATLYQVYLDPHYRKQKIADKLLNSLIKTLQSNKINNVHLFVSQTQTGAIKLYQRCGFSITGKNIMRLGDGLLHEGLLMEKKI